MQQCHLPHTSIWHLCEDRIGWVTFMLAAWLSCGPVVAGLWAGGGGGGQAGESISCWGSSLMPLRGQQRFVMSLLLILVLLLLLCISILVMIRVTWVQWHTASTHPHLGELKHRTIMARTSPAEGRGVMGRYCTHQHRAPQWARWAGLLIRTHKYV